MSKDIIVLTPNGRRQKVHCTPDTSILQVLEDVCLKQGFQPSDYDLKHHNHLLDLTTTLRFSNLPNKATLEMVEAEKKREEYNVTIGLTLEDGERRTADFSPNTCLYDLVTSLAGTELNQLNQPTISYMRQEVIGVLAMKEKTLRQMGLIKGRAILRLLDKAEEARQANVSAVYRRPVAEAKQDDITSEETLKKSTTEASSSNKPFNPIDLIKKEKATKIELPDKHQEVEEEVPKSEDLKKPDKEVLKKEKVIQIDTKPISSKATLSQEALERRLNIEEEVTFLGTQKAIAYTQPEDNAKELDDLPDDFYELSIEEVRKIYYDLQQNRLQLENTPLITMDKRQELLAQTSQQKIAAYKNVVVRIQFPDRIILQGVFSPSNTIGDVNNFVKEHLQEPKKPFLLFTTPLKEPLDSKLTLLEAKFVPCVHMHFKYVDNDVNQKYLKDEIYSKKTESDAASIFASKYRAPTRRKMEESSDSSVNSNKPSTSTSKNSKIPKWFKN